MQLSPRNIITVFCQDLLLSSKMSMKSNSFLNNVCCEAMLMKMIFDLKLLELKFTKNGFNRGLIMKVGVNRTQNAAQDSTPIWLKFHKINRKKLFG